MAKNDAKKGGNIIIVKKKGGHGHGHHGGSWKVALADFMTAMMAFFLLMWLLETATPKELMAIAGYFQAPGSKYVVGPGGADASIVDQKSPLEETPIIETSSPSPMDSAGLMGESRDDPSEDKISVEEPEKKDEALLKKQLEEIEKKQLEELKEKIQEQINNLDSVLNELKDQIRLEFTQLGLSIQIIDKEKRSMFDEGSAHLQDFAEQAILTLAPIVDSVPNKISLVGHTDATPYGQNAAYSNWELSSDRANSARRALIYGKYPEEKVIAVQGMASIAPLVPTNPRDPTNRRIAIVVLKKEVSDAMMKVDPVAGQDMLNKVSALKSKSSAKVDAKSDTKVMTELEIQQAIEAKKMGNL